MGENNGFIYRIFSSTNIIGRPPRFSSSNGPIPRGSQFASVYAVRQEDARAIEETATTAAGFKGIVWSKRLWVDFDNKEAAKVAINWLKEEGYGFSVYSTGSIRGIHIGIDRIADPSHILPLLDKQWVEEHLPGADLSLYWHLHLIRLPGAVHESTGERKRLVYKQDGKSIQKGSINFKEMGSKVSTIPEGTRKSIFSSWAVTSSLTSNGDQGSRHEQLLKLAIALKKECGVTADEAMWVTAEVNRGFDDPKGQDEIERIIRWVYEEIKG